MRPGMRVWLGVQTQQIRGLVELSLSACGSKKVWLWWSWRSCYHLYWPFRRQKDSRLDSRGTLWLIKTNLFRTTHRVKTQKVSKSRGQWCDDIEDPVYLDNVVGPVSLVMDLRIEHEVWGSTSNPSLHDHLHYPTDIDRTLVIIVPLTFYFYRLIGKLTGFL